VDNPFVVGEAIGAGLVLAVIVFVVTRKLCGPAGARHLARLKRLAGEEVEESRLSLYVRDWLPYAAALMAALVGGLFSLAKAGVLLHKSFSSNDMPQLAAGFKSGCERSCGAQRDTEFCAGLCDCTFATLRSRHPSEDAFAAWMQAGPQHVDAVKSEVMSAQAACLQAIDPSAAASLRAASAAASGQAPVRAPEPPAAGQDLDLEPPQYDSATLKRIREDFELFVKWAAVAQTAPEKLTGAEVCAAAGDPSAGICTKSVAAAGFSEEVYSASYKPGAPGAVRLAVTVSFLVDCNALAPSRTLAQWRQAQSAKQLCEISSGPLKGLQLLAVRSQHGTSLFAYSAAYPARDAAFAATLERPAAGAPDPALVTRMPPM
jgi:hypothetical protein